MNATMPASGLSFPEDFEGLPLPAVTPLRPMTAEPERLSANDPPRVSMFAGVTEEFFEYDGEEVSEHVVHVGFATGEHATFTPNLALEVNAHTLELQTGWIWDHPLVVAAVAEALESLRPHRPRKISWPAVVWNDPDHPEAGVKNVKVNTDNLRNDVEKQLNSNFRVGYDKRLWWYHNGAYIPTGEEAARQKTFELLATETVDTGQGLIDARFYKPYHADTVVRGFRDRSGLTPLPEKPNERFLNVRNGMLDWRSGSVVPHDHRYASTVQLAARWNPEAKCERFDAFLKQLMPEVMEQDPEYVWEVLGYILFPRNPFHALFILRGPPRSGKSTFLRVVRALVGSFNAAAIPLSSFTTNRFATARMYGKLLNVCGDISADDLTDLSLIKQMTGEDELDAEFKFKDAFSYTSFATHIYSANVIPLTDDKSGAFEERLQILPCLHALEPKRRDPTLSAALTSASELEGVLAHAVRGLRALMERGRFSPPEVVVQEVDSYRRRNNPLVGFIADEIERDVDAVTPTTVIGVRLAQWCVREGVAVPDEWHATFADLARAVYSSTRINDQKVKVWRGIRLREEAGT